MANCLTCGARLPKGSAFCNVCGSPVPASAQEKPRRPLRLLSLLLGAALPILIALVLLFTGVLPIAAPAPTAEPARLQGEGYDTPEAALQAYLDFLRQGDLDGMLSVFALESHASQMDFAASIEYSPYNLTTGNYSSGPLPPVSDTARAFNLEGFRSAAARDLYQQYLYFMLRGTEYLNSSYQYFPSSKTETAEREALAAALDREVSFSELQFLGFVESEPYFTDRQAESFRRYQTRQLAAAGAEELRELSAEIRLDGEDFVLFFTLARYEGRWYILNLGNYLYSSARSLQEDSWNAWNLLPGSVFRSWEQSR